MLQVKALKLVVFEQKYYQISIVEGRRKYRNCLYWSYYIESIAPIYLRIASVRAAKRHTKVDSLAVVYGRHERIYLKNILISLHFYTAKSHLFYENQLYLRYAIRYAK